MSMNRLGLMRVVIAVWLLYTESESSFFKTITILSCASRRHRSFALRCSTEKNRGFPVRGIDVAKVFQAKKN